MTVALLLVAVLFVAWVGLRSCNRVNAKTYRPRSNERRLPRLRRPRPSETRRSGTDCTEEG